jgi:hypothetical protein
LRAARDSPGLGSRELGIGLVPVHRAAALNHLDHFFLHPTGHSVSFKHGDDGSGNRLGILAHSGMGSVPADDAQRLEQFNSCLEDIKAQPDRPKPARIVSGLVGEQGQLSAAA